MKGIFYDIKEWFKSLALVFGNSLRLVFKDPGIMLFFFALPLAYPVVYTLIYNPELAENVSVAVVDNCRTSRSRELVRHLDATQQIDIIGYAASMDEAKRWMHEKGCFGILEIPGDYSKKIGRGEQAIVPFYSDMSLLLRYRGFLMALTEIQMATGAEIRQEGLDRLGLPFESMGSLPVESESFFLGDTEQGFASFVIPGIVVLILQQSIVLGMTMLAGTSAERRRRNGGRDPEEIDAPLTATILGKVLSVFVCYIPMVVYILHFIPLMFHLPHEGIFIEMMLYAVPLIIASTLFGISLTPIVKERESSLMVVVFTSVVFLFLSGLTWPRYAMNDFWYWVGNLIPATWGVEGFIRINSNGATLAQNSTPYLAMWALAGIYFITAYIALSSVRRSSRRQGNLKTFTPN